MSLCSLIGIILFFKFWGVSNNISNQGHPTKEIRVKVFQILKQKLVYLYFKYFFNIYARTPPAQIYIFHNQKQKNMNEFNGRLNIFIKKYSDNT